MVGKEDINRRTSVKKLSFRRELLTAVMEANTMCTAHIEPRPFDHWGFTTQDKYGVPPSDPVTPTFARAP